MSKQLAISIAFSVMTMSAFALTTSPRSAEQNAAPGYSNGAVAEAAAPSLFRVIAN